VRVSVGGRERRAREDGRRAARGGDIPALEWATALLGALLLAGTVAFLVRQAIVSDDTPGAVLLTVKQVRPVGAGYVVQLEARNGGTATYAELEIEGTLRSASGREERASVTLDYLPGQSSREAGLFFRSDPARGVLELVPKGFREP
jgi:uncharacterized protein (TIGR02588 family)